jgi:hypothetical protein
MGLENTIRSECPGEFINLTLSSVDFAASDNFSPEILHNATTVADFLTKFWSWKSRGFSVVMGAEALP